MPKPLSCYLVELPTTNALNNCVAHRDTYLNVECGCLYVIATDAAAVGEEFPQAITIRRVGVGFEDSMRPAR